MKIKLKIEAESGEDLRNQLISILGGYTTQASEADPKQVKQDEIAEVQKPAKKTATKKVETPAEEPKTEETTEAVETEVEEPKTEEPKSQGIDKAGLTPILIQKGREGKRDAVVALLKKFGAVNAKDEAGLPHLDPAKYTDFHAELIRV